MRRHDHGDLPRRHEEGLNGQCFFVDPGCQGPNCGPVTTGCPFGAARKADGSCCTARDYQVGGAVAARRRKPTAPVAESATWKGTVRRRQQAAPAAKFSSIMFAAVVPARSTMGTANVCGRTRKRKSRWHTTPRKPRPKTDSDNPAKASGSRPQFNIQIGPGFPSGGRPGGKPSGGTPKGGGNCLKQYCG